ncbi:TPA: hypothetical protein ACGXDT_001580 [Streptococcus pyogenes]|uniref:hypothetical protein n=1 Tax=Streptococcus pyogenes TaxID=1314 RepID=UPI000F6F1AE6|nr:hypothetical protein [Streptococcus pyogenes]HER4598207.1 hypothetical protein [Streptococcus pyogenes NGAS606]HER4727924.1 hypothetical protein [Streptococcus pyogenes NGAS312]VED83509.1 Uncharacterised protein [Streptococcus pyogenes]VGS64587.1 Uncharacterised protein [Streptococcus pyogenes]HEP6034724.1 hypothetical protein [Streptococcus pyogenes]
MSNIDVISKLYYTVLGQTLRERMKSEHVKIIDFGFDDVDDTKSSSDSTIRGILNGICNLTTNSVKIFLQTLNHNTSQEMYFPSDGFCIQIIKEIFKLVIYSNHFNNSIFKQTMLQQLGNNHSNPKYIEYFVEEHKEIFLKSFLPIVPKESKEFSSKYISFLICDWLIELACIISQNQ